MLIRNVICKVRSYINVFLKAISEKVIEQANKQKTIVNWRMYCINTHMKVLNGPINGER